MTAARTGRQPSLPFKSSQRDIDMEREPQDKRGGTGTAGSVCSGLDAETSSQGCTPSFSSPLDESYHPASQCTASGASFQLNSNVSSADDISLLPSTSENTHQGLNNVVSLGTASQKSGPPLRPPPPRSQVRQKQRKQQVQEKICTLSAKEMKALSDTRCHHLRMKLKAQYGVYMDVDRPNRRITLNGLTSLPSALTKAQSEIKEMAHKGIQKWYSPKPPRPPPPSHRQQRHSVLSLPEHHSLISDSQYCPLLPQSDNTVEDLSDETQPSHNDQQTHPSLLTQEGPGSTAQVWPTCSDVRVKSKVHRSAHDGKKHQNHSASMPVFRKKHKLSAKEMKVLDSAGYQLRETLNREYNIDMVIDSRRKTVILVGPTSAARFFTKAQSEIERCVHGQPAISCRLTSKCQSAQIPKPSRPPPPTVQPQNRNKVPQALPRASHDNMDQRRQHMYPQDQIKRFKLSPRIMASLTDCHCRQLHQTLMGKFKIYMKVNREKQLITLKGLTSAAPYFLKAENEIKVTACHQLLLQQCLTQDHIGPQRTLRHSNTVPPLSYSNQLQGAPQAAVAIPLPSEGKPPRPPPPRHGEQANTLVLPAGKKALHPPPPKPLFAWGHIGSSTGRHMQEQVLKKTVKLSPKETQSLSVPQCQQLLMEKYGIDMEVNYKRNEITLAGLTSRAPFFTKAQREVIKMVRDGTRDIQTSKASPGAVTCNPHLQHPSSLTQQMNSQQTSQLPHAASPAIPTAPFTVTEGPIDLIPHNPSSTQSPDCSRSSSSVSRGNIASLSDIEASELSSPATTDVSTMQTSPWKTLSPATSLQRLTPCREPVASSNFAANRPRRPPPPRRGEQTNTLVSTAGKKAPPPRPPPPTKRSNTKTTSSVVAEHQKSSIRLQSQAKTFKLPAKQIAALTKPWYQHLTKTLHVKYNLRIELDTKKEVVTLHGLTSAAPYFIKAQDDIRRTTTCLLEVKEELMFVPAPSVLIGKRNPTSAQNIPQRPPLAVCTQQQQQSPFKLSATFSPLIPEVKPEGFKDTVLPNFIPEAIANGSLSQPIKGQSSPLPPPPSCDQKKQIKLSQTAVVALTDHSYQRLRQDARVKYNIKVEFDRRERRMLLSGPTSAAKFFAKVESEVLLTVRGRLQTSKEIVYSRHVGLVLSHKDYPSRIQKIVKGGGVTLKYSPKPQWGIQLAGNQAAVGKVEIEIKSIIRSIEIDEDQLQVSATYLPAFPTTEFRNLRRELEKSLAIDCQYPDILSLPSSSEEQPVAATKERVSVPDYMWSWENDSGSYSPYPDNVSKSITSAFLKNNTGEHTIQTNGKEYKVDFQRMLQTNIATGYIRRVQYEQPLVEIENDTEEDDSLSSYEPPHLVITVRGMKRNLSKAKARIKEELEKVSMMKQLPLSIAPTSDLKLKVREIATEHTVSYRIENSVIPGGSMEGKWTLEVTGLRDAVQKAHEQVLMEVFSFQSSGNARRVPQDWQRQQTNTVELFDIRPGMAEYDKYAGQMKETMPRATISRIRRIQNRYLWDKYSQQERRLHEKNNGQTAEKMLFHGTRGNDPKLIYDSEEGFDMRYSEAGMWGHANYFAVNASYSHSYAHTAPDGSKLMFLARVLTGDSYTSPSDRSLRRPPKKTQGNSSSGTVCLSEMSYDTVNGQTGGSTVYMTYENHSAYPAYLIQYRMY